MRHRRALVMACAGRRSAGEPDPSTSRDTREWTHFSPQCSCARGLRDEVHRVTTPFEGQRDGGPASPGRGTIIEMALLVAAGPDDGLACSPASRKTRPVRSSARVPVAGHRGGAPGGDPWASGAGPSRRSWDQRWCELWGTRVRGAVREAPAEAIAARRRPRGRRQRSHNPSVVGSSPTRPTSIMRLTCNFSSSLADTPSWYQRRGANVESNRSVGHGALRHLWVPVFPAPCPRPTQRVAAWLS